jgi:hypothetical protein
MFADTSTYHGHKSCDQRRALPAWQAPYERGAACPRPSPNDSEGRPTDAATQCISLTLQPSFVVYLAIAIIVLVAFTRALKRADSEAAAIRTLDRAVFVVIAVVAASILIGHIGFWMIPVTEWDGIGTFWFPYPFGIVGADSSPISGG